MTPFSLPSISMPALLAHPPGVYRLVLRSRPAPILTSITDWGWVAGYINGRAVQDKQSFLHEAGQAMAFPGYYGRNWDAFEEMVNDLSWVQAAGYVILYDYVHHFASRQPDAWQTALSILDRACANWQAEGTPFYVLLRHNWFWNRHLPKLAT